MYYTEIISIIILYSMWNINGIYLIRNITLLTYNVVCDAPIYNNIWIMCIVIELGGILAFIITFLCE